MPSGVRHDDAVRNKRLYREASSQQQTWNDNATENLDYYFGAHWTAEQRNALLERGQQPVAIQTIFQVVEQAVGMLTANRPSFRATPREDGDRRVAAVFSDLFQWIWSESRGQQRIVNIIRDNYVQGRGVALAYVDWDADFGKGEVKFKDLDPKEVFPDPRCTDPLWDDAGWIIVRRLFTLSQIGYMWGTDVAAAVEEYGDKLSDYPFSSSKYAHRNQQIHPFDLNAGLASADEDQQLYEVIERYEKVRRPHYRFMNPQTGVEEVLDEQEFQERIPQPAYVVTEQGVDRVVTDPNKVAALDEVYQTLGAVYHLSQAPPQMDPNTGQMMPMEPVPMSGPESEDPSAIPGSSVAMEPVTIGELIDRGVIPLTPFMLNRVRVSTSSGNVLVMDPFELPTEHYPIVVFPNTTNRNPYPVSDVDRLKDLQDMINKSQSLILAHLATSTNMKVFYPEGSIPDLNAYEQEWSKAGSALIPYNPGFGVGGGSPGGIVIAQPPQLPAALYNNIDRAIALMERIAGIYAMQQGEPNQGPGTFRGTLAQDEFGLRRMKHKMDLLHQSLERLGTVMLNLAQRVYTERKVIRLVSPDGQLLEQEMNALQYDEYTGEAERINDVTLGRYDLIIVAGSTLPSNRWAKLDTYLQLFDRGIVDDVAVLRSTEMAEADDILERKSIYSQQQQALQQYEEQLGSLQGDLQTWQREALHANQRTEIAKFQAKLASMENKVKQNVETFRIALAGDREKARLTAMLSETKKPNSSNSDG